jgi:hypothetical protein
MAPFYVGRLLPGTDVKASAGELDAALALCQEAASPVFTCNQ